MDRGARARKSEIGASPGDLHTQCSFQLAQMRVQRTAKVGQAPVVLGLKGMV